MSEQVITWRELNERLREIKTEAEAEKFYQSLQRNPHATSRWTQRAYARYSKLRRRREYKELKGRKAQVAK